MKTFVQFLKESAADGKEMPQEMTFTFNFKELPDAEETIKSIVDTASKDGLKISSSDDKVTLSLTRSQCDNKEADEVSNIIKQYAEIVRKDQQNSSRESFAQLTKSFKEEYDKMQSFIDFVPEEPKKDDEE